MKSFRPANSTEGEFFMEKFCFRCVHDDYENERYCQIIGGSMLHEVKDIFYPTELIYDENGRATCTKFTEV